MSYLEDPESHDSVPGRSDDTVTAGRKAAHGANSVRPRRHWLQGSAVVACLLMGLAFSSAVATAASAGGNHAVATAASAKGKGKVLTIGSSEGLGTSPESLDPALHCCGTLDVLALAYEPIIYANANGSFGPGLATSWHYLRARKGGQPNTRFEFTLRQNAKFSDGTPVTARAVKAWLDYYPTAKGPALGLLNIPVQSIKTVGKWTVLITLKQPVSNMPSELSDGVTSYGSVAGPVGLAHPTSLSTESDGAGPYVLDAKASVPTSEYTFVPNKYYYDKAAIYWSKVVVRVIPSATSRLAALRTGQIQVDESQTDTSTAAEAAADGFRTLAVPSGYYGLHFMDLGGTIVKALADVRVRQAISYAINRKAMVNAFFAGYATPTSELPMWDGFDPSYQNYYSYNPAKAKTLLAAAGYPHGFNLTITTATSVPAALSLAQATASYLEAVGINVTIDDQPSSLTSGTFPIWSCDGCDSTSTATFYVTYLKPGGLINQHGWSNPALASLYNKAETSAKPKPEWRKIMQLQVTQAYAAPVAIVDNLFFYSPHLTGLSGSRERYWMNPTEIKPS